MFKRNKAYILILIISVYLLSCQTHNKKLPLVYQEKFNVMIQNLDSLSQQFNFLKIDSTLYFINEIDSICQSNNCDSLLNIKLEYKELDAIYRFLNYYLEQYSDLKKELVSSYDHINFLKYKIKQGEYVDSIIKTDINKEEALIIFMEDDFSVKLVDLQQYYENYQERYKRLIAILSENN